LSPKGGDFPDEFDDLYQKIGGLSDNDLERLMGRAEGKDQTPGTIHEKEPGSQVRGIVVDYRGGEILVELDGKDLGVIDESEFFGEQPPIVGEEIQAEYVGYNQSKEAVILTVKGIRKQVAWDDLRTGTLLDGTVVDTNKGGLTLDIKGIRAFMPISQIALERVEDLSPFVGRKMRCEVTSLDRGNENLIVSRRRVLESEAHDRGARVFEKLKEGEILTGTVVRITDHGAFIDLGGCDGLLHASKIHQQLKGAAKSTLSVGQSLPVEIVRIDRERHRIALDFKHIEADAWGGAIGDYSVGDQVTGWISKVSGQGVVLSIEEGIDGWIPAANVPNLGKEPLAGDIVSAVIASVDSVKRVITLNPTRD